MTWWQVELKWNTYSLRTYFCYGNDIYIEVSIQYRNSLSNSNTCYALSYNTMPEGNIPSSTWLAAEYWAKNSKHLFIWSRSRAEPIFPLHKRTLDIMKAIAISMQSMQFTLSMVDNEQARNFNS